VVFFACFRAGNRLAAPGCCAPGPFSFRRLTTFYYFFFTQPMPRALASGQRGITLSQFCVSHQCKSINSSYFTRFNSSAATAAGLGVCQESMARQTDSSRQQTACCG
jgi:hypothetical protein